MLEDELLLVLVYLGSQGGIVVLYSKVVLDQVKGLLVDLLVLMALQKFNLIQAWGVGGKARGERERERKWGGAKLKEIGA